MNVSEGPRHQSRLPSTTTPTVRRHDQHNQPVRRSAPTPLRAYAAATATTTSWETIRDAATGGLGDKPARTTTAASADVLTALRNLGLLEGWLPTANHLTRLATGPKHHLADPALAARLLDRTADHLLTGDPDPVPAPRAGTLLGALLESLAALSVRTFAQAAGARAYHLRDQGGRHEVDFIVERAGAVLALEGKLAATAGDADVRHLRWLGERLGDQLVDAVVLTTGTDAYRRRDGIGVVPLAALGA